MVSNKIVLILCFGVILASGCSRQQSDWQKTRETNTADAYESFLKKYPSGEFTPQAQARIKELYEERDWQKARDADTPEAYQAFVKQYPEGKWTEEARIRVENFTLAQAPGSSAATADGAAAPNGVAGAKDAAGGEPVSSDADAASQGGAPAPGPAVPAPAAPSARTALPGPVPKIAHSAKPASAPVASTTTAASGAPKARTGAAKLAAAAGGGRYGIQLGAFKSDRSAADKRWARLQKEFPRVLAGLSSTVLPKETATGNWYRLQAVGLTEKHARSICSSLKAQSEACLVVHPTRG